MATANAFFNAPMSTPAELPADVRLMNAVSGVLFAILGVAVLVLAVMWLARAPVFTLKAIRVEGDVTRNSLSTIRANAAPKLAGNFFTMDLRAGQQAFQTVPWVRQAVVKRVWPNRLTVQLEEHRPAALWSQQGSTGDGTEKIVNTFGEVFEANLGDVEDDRLPTLSGGEGTSTQMLLMLQQLSPVLDKLDGRIETLSLSSRGSWRAELDNGAEIEFGRGTEEEVIARAERFVSTVTQVMSQYQRPLEYADLRHNQGYAVRLKGITTTLTANEKTSRN
jgi:cell division protein FtsQ